MKKKKNVNITQIKNPFSEGIISIITIDPTRIINRRRLNRYSSKNSIERDFIAIGNDLRKALSIVKQEMDEEENKYTYELK